MGDKIAVAAFDHILIQELRGASSRRLKVPAHYATISPNGKWLATRLHNDRSYLRNASDGSVVRAFPVQANLQFSPDGHNLAVIQENKLELIECSGWERLWEIPLDASASMPPSFSFSADGALLAIAYNRYEVRLYDTATARELATFSPPFPGQIIGAHGLTFSADGRWLVAAKDDGDVIAWDLPVVRAKLAALGLDWEKQEVRSANRLTPDPGPLPTDGRGRIGRPVHGFNARNLVLGKSLPIERRGRLQDHVGKFAFAATALAVLAGGFVFVVQRRMIASYERVEALAEAQRQKLQTAQDELLHSQKMRALGTLAAGIAHDFNNLLSVIRLSNQLAAEQTNPKGTARENMDAIESAVSQGENIVNSMLGYSRVAAEIDKDYSVADAVNESVAMLGKKFLAGIILKLEIAPDLPRVRGARGRLEQMLLNLIVNASEAMAAQGELRLAVREASEIAAPLLAPRPAAQYVEVLVGDSGPGIPPEILPRIFEPFFTTKNTGARPGTGLGLATVYTMAQQDGLGLAVETAEGKGTTFRILIPA